ncbi:Rieske 2Fe-2S domain-containing protein [Mycolicibacterium elephantis]|uniref:Rieske 2Fe-2S domain-containing protein n=1 Tax=Mycolicibacterium elephantis TaxID=81858 RepID=UPI000629D1E1|nr:Rieske 2Fe-2S domain-containing protein [Mycolicibacterium elephantis]KKW64367.1 Rieske (2Fe-2S) protein [Mycolicibacterium elephantis]OBA81067.1 Rieske (2Fe-2S) protein [Mycolicibacterium elephantis]OBB16870.1 Rieske (2Fe-2S) protein [Mycolicibacterium elephantis]OBE95696.1 Rieske (2Fe-2S) protein [Mycolicibacterium elephantis]
MTETTETVDAASEMPVFPASDGSRIPYEIYTSQAVYDREQERLFRGPIWNYLALEAELPNPFDFKSTFVGDTPVVVTRDGEGRLAAWVNRCAHRGAIVCREQSGNTRSHACVYHQWSYNAAGDLEGVPFRRGANGTGMPKSFDPKQNGLQKLRVESYRGLVFGTFDEATPELLEYLGNQTPGLDRIFHKPIEYLGCTRQRIRGNWKLYLENVRDGYHASLLHAFHSTFNLVRSGQRVKIVVGDTYEVHNCGDLFYTEDPTKGAAYANVASFKEGLRLENPDVVENWQEFDEIITNHLQCVFPQLVVMQIQNVLAVRNVLPKGVDEFELIFNFFGYADDTPEMRQHRIAQFNLVGPAGLISMEDGEAIELVQRATAVGPAGEAIALMALEADEEHRNQHPISEDAIRRFWVGYQKLMGL